MANNESLHKVALHLLFGDKILYGQTIGTTETHALSPFNVPMITVTP